MLRNHLLLGTFSFLCTVLSAGTAIRPAEAAGIAAGQAAVTAQAGGMPGTQQITQAINNSQLSPMQNDVRPEVGTAIDQGRVNDNLPLDNMLVLLHRPAAQEQALEAFMAEQTTPGSPNYQNWLTAEEVGQYGLAQSDLDTISNWLVSQGFTVNKVHADGVMIDFSGTAGQVRKTFKTEVHNLNVNGVEHVANTSIPQIPSALAPAVVGIVSINDFTPHTNYKPKPDYTFTNGSGTFYPMVPADLATIYNLNPLFNATPTAINGAGQTIVLIEDTNVHATADITTFRSTFGLPTASFSQVQPGSCTSPGDVAGNDGEAELDVEWAGAAAPSATLELASCKDTATTFGGLIAMQNLNTANDPARLWSISYGECEAENGATANAAYVSTYQSAAARGVSVFVSSGDEGAASCDANATKSTHGIGVSGFASTPYNVAVGGTDFGDTYAGTNSTYWNTANGATYASAVSYVNEIPWNDSCAGALLSTFAATFGDGNGLPYGTAGFCNSTVGNAGYLTTVSGSGGPSGCATGTAAKTGVVGGTCAGTAKPSWQSGFLGNPGDGVRDIPDVSLFAANGVWSHYYVFCYTGTAANGGAACTAGNPSVWSGAGGTSFASPIMAGIQALVNQKTASSQGNPNPTYYALAKTEYGASGSAACNSTLGNGVASSCTFYDVTQGDIDVNCTGTNNCYRPSGTNGVLSTSTTAYQPAYGTQTGWDFATGIGSVNAANLVANWPAPAKTNQTITFTSTAPTGAIVAGPTYTVTATASSGLTVALTIDAMATSVCSLSGSTVSFTAAGSCVIDANQAGNGTYGAAPQQQQSFPVAQGNQTINFPNPGPVTYAAGGTFALSATASSGLAVSYASNSASVCTVAGSTGTIVTAGTCSITASQAGNANYKTASPVTDSFTISQVSQTIAFTSAATSPSVGSNYTVTATGGASSSPVTFSVDAGSTAGACTIISPTVTFTGIGNCIIDANQAGDTDYSAAPQAQQTVTVGKGSQTITFNSTAPTIASVGGATYAVNATSSSNLSVALTIDASASAVCSLSGSTVSFIGAGSCVIDGNQAGNSNYNAATQAQQMFAVGKGNQTITFPNPAAQTYSPGGTFALNATASSSLAVTYASTTTDVCTVTGATATIVSAGTCSITASQAGSVNYNSAAPVSVAVAIGAASQVITFTSQAPVDPIVGGSYAVTATGGASGNVVTFSVDAGSTTGACTLNGATVSFTGTGSCLIDANQVGNTNYSAAAQAQQVVGIGVATQSITITSTPSNPAVGGNYAVTATGGGSGNPVVFSIDAASSPGVCTIMGSVVSFSAIGTCVIDANQAGNASYSVAAQVRQSVAVGIGQATQLVFTTQPADVLAGGKLASIEVTEEDQAGDVIQDSTSVVNFTIAACGGSANLGSVTLTNGVGTLSGSSQVFYTVASGLQINAVTGALSGQSAAFNVVLNNDLLFENGFESCQL